MIGAMEPGMYLVGRKDGSQHPFYVKVEPDGVAFGGDDNLVRTAQAVYDCIKNAGHWWWQTVEIPTTVPASFADFPPFRKGRGS